MSEEVMEDTQVCGTCLRRKPESEFAYGHTDCRICRPDLEDKSGEYFWGGRVGKPRKVPFKKPPTAQSKAKKQSLKKKRRRR